jgi:CDP-paratose 2-epimerase
LRAVFFGDDGSTAWNRERLATALPNYVHHDTDIRDNSAIDRIFERYGNAISLVLHAAAQPSHDWAAREPITDFSVNAVGTLNLLESTRRHCPEAAFIFTSTNKVYGDTPNALPFEELDTRWEIEPDHTYADGIREDMSIDRCLHSLFGVSKVAADVLVQEYGHYFELRTACFRGGTLTGPQHSAVELHGFLAYLMRCAMTGTPYTVYGYKGKQVRDALHSRDLVEAFHAFYAAPRQAEVYNIGGGRTSHTSVIEAIAMCEQITGRDVQWTYSDENRVGDHIWWVSDNGRFQSHYPEWRVEYDVPKILHEINEANLERWQT